MEVPGHVRTGLPVPMPAVLNANPVVPMDDDANVNHTFPYLLLFANGNTMVPTFPAWRVHGAWRAD
eukprot:3372907-Rhodomonas_salina.1